MEIVKVQTPIVGGHGEALVYDSKRGRDALLPITEALRKKMRGEPKAFFYAEWTGETWTLGEPAPWQNW